MWSRVVLFTFLAAAVCAGRPNFPPFTKEDILMTCERNNVTSDKLEQAKISLEEHMKCNSDVPDIGRLSSDMERARANGTMDKVARRSCTNSELHKSCLASIIKTFGLCAIIDLETEVSYLTNTINRIIEYSCTEEEHKMKLTKLYEAGILRCIEIRGGEIAISCDQVPDELNTLQATFQYYARCTVDQMKACSTAAGDRAQDMLDYVRP